MSPKENVAGSHATNAPRFAVNYSVLCNIVNSKKQYKGFLWEHDKFVRLHCLLT